MRKELFDFAVLLQPKKNKDGEWEGDTEIVVPKTSVLAADEERAKILAARAIPEQYLNRLDQLEIKVGPF